VSTTSGCAGLGLVDGESVQVADAPEDFAAAVTALLANTDKRRNMARAAREHALRNFDWRAIGEKQRELFR
jgi:glycosyltransferase involved in cell wall biosynthesis